MLATYLQEFVDNEKLAFKIQEIVLRLMREYDMLKADQTDRLVSVCVEQKIRNVFKNEDLVSEKDRGKCVETMMKMTKDILLKNY